MTKTKATIGFAAIVLAGALLAPTIPAAAAVPSGQVFAWGNNAQGQLGNGTLSRSTTPVAVQLPGGVTATAVAGGAYHSLALTSTGSVFAWGYNAEGELGDGTNTNSTTPVAVKLPINTTVTAVAAGLRQSLALTSTGRVLAWGDGSSGQLGNSGTANSNVPVPVSLPGGTSITGISAGAEHGLALTSTGGVLAWGANVHGQLGNGSTMGSDTPVAVSLPGSTTVTSVSAGEWFNLARTSTGGVLAWGGDYNGQLGNGTTNTTGCACSETPVAVSLPNGTSISAVAAGGYHSLGLTSSGGVLSWGSNSAGQLGNGVFGGPVPCGCSTTPVAVLLPSGTTATALAAGNAHSLALTSTGAVLAWGKNSKGQLGNGTTGNSNVPISANLPSGTASAIGGGPLALHSLAVESARGLVSALVFSPGRIAAPGTLAAGATVAVTLTVADSSGSAIPGATVFLSFQQAPGGGSATVGSTTLTSTPARFVADISGHVAIVYHAPSPVPATGKDYIKAQNTAVGPTVTKFDGYSFSA